MRGGKPSSHGAYDDVATLSDFVKKLNEIDAIVGLDEQRTAYTDMKKQTDFYQTCGTKIRVLLTCSNQASFDTSLNTSYANCPRHVQPFTDAEASLDNQKRGWNLDAEKIKFFCNTVPREI